MKTLFFSFLILILVIGTVNAQEEEAKYNFGSAQSASEISLAPGDEVTTKLYFYNIYGNRITHITLEVAEAPKDWEVSIEPALHETSVVVSGISTTVEENLFVQPPSDVAESIPDDVPEGIEYISSPVGFVGAKPVLITIKVPDDEKLGTVAKISIDGIASWLGQTGTAAITQGRSFEYTVTVVSKEFTEEIVQPAVVDAEEVSEAVSEAAEPVGEIPTLLSESAEKESEKVVTATGINSTALLMTIIIVLLAVLIFVLVKRKR